MSFNDRDYTREAVIKQLGLIELHCKDGSAIDAGCQCIDTKHLFLIEGLAEEGQGFALSSQEREFYENLANFVRLTRKRMEVEDYNLHGVMREVMRAKHPTPLMSSNPGPSKLAFTKCELDYPTVKKKIISCVQQTEKKPGAWTQFNPVAVCRAAISCPPK